MTGFDDIAIRASSFAVLISVTGALFDMDFSGVNQSNRMPG